MPFYPSMTALRNVLAELYGTDGAARTVAADAGLTLEHIGFSGPAVEFWFNILSEAEAQDRIEAIVAVARKAYPSNKRLQEAAQAYAQRSPEEQQVASPASLTGQPSIDTGGGAAIGRDAQVGGDFTGRDSVRYEPGSQHIEYRYYGVTDDAEVGASVAVSQEEPAPGDPPYQGLQYFDVEDADRFFGREQLTDELVRYLRSHRFLAVIGASGSGKSSVVRAGVVPALKSGEELADGTLPPKGSADWLVHIVTPTSHPLKALSASLTKGSESVTAQATLIEDMKRHAVSLDLFVSRMLADSPADHLLLVVDQFEELFTLCKDADERKQFVDNLLAAAQPDGAVTVLLTLRADFYHRCAEFDDLRQALANYQEYIGAMSEEELRAAIEKPAELDDWNFEPGLVDVMLADVEHEPGALPLLSHALLETWNNRRGRTMTFGGYYEAGGVKGAIATRADTEFNDLSPDEQAVARNIFVRLTQLGEGSEDTRRRVARDELLGTGKDAETVASVLTTLGYARLITVDQDEVEVAHEALIREWPTLRKWLEDDREGLRVHRRLTETAKEWDDAGRKLGDLYRGTRLDQTLEWAQTNGDSLNDLERAFLDASREQVEAEQREKKAADRRTRNRTRIAFSAVLIALAFASAIAWFLFQQNHELAGERLLQEARQLKANLDAERAIAKFEQAAAYPNITINLSEEISDTLRYVATELVYAGEALASEGDRGGAAEKFSEALALNPPSDTPVYVWIEPGEFRMGSTKEDVAAAVELCVSQGSEPEDCERWMGNNVELEHTVYLDGYWIQRTEVTNEQYARCVKSGECEPPGDDLWKQRQFAKQPVTDVDWFQADKYARWVGGSLPTEAQWEKACRGTEGWVYPWGSDSADPSLLNYWYSGPLGMIEVGGYPPGANGLYDMAGNAYEWTADWYDSDYYANSPSENPRGPESGEQRTLRGGSWNTGVSRARCARRNWVQPDKHFNDGGFRVSSPGAVGR